MVLNLFSRETNCSYVKAVRALRDFACLEEAMELFPSFPADGSVLSGLRLDFLPEDF